ncbi:MAG: FAD-binding oxidoreductase [Fimbriimonadaceae bacterium]|nr:FAD-binding oxidoreductase [Fimbriimonadaceae bacterium]
MVSQTVRPDSIEAIADLVAGAHRVYHLQPHPFRGLAASAAMDGTWLDLSRWSGVVHHYADDQTVVVRAGTSLSELQAALAGARQTIPWAQLDGPALDSDITTLIGLNLPHPLMAQHGTWRDWVLGMTVVRANGTVVKLGSRAVKNVAGYDGTRLLTGSRGIFGIVIEATLRTYPLGGLATLDLQLGREDVVHCIYRLQRADVELECERLAESLVAYDRAAHTLYLSQAVPAPLPHAHRWEVGKPPAQSTAVSALRVAMKRALDPDDKLNPGEYDEVVA